MMEVILYFIYVRFIPSYYVRSRQLTQGCLFARKSLVASFKVKRAIQAKQDPPSKEACIFQANFNLHNDTIIKIFFIILFFFILNFIKGVDNTQLKAGYLNPIRLNSKPVSLICTFCCPLLYWIILPII